MSTSKHHFMPNIVGLVLAGGASQRMGRDKTRLKLNNETLLSRNLRLLADTGLEKIVISGPQKGAIPDNQPLKGPAHAILHVLNQAQISTATHFLVIPVDMPLLTSDLLQTLTSSVNHSLQSRYFERFPLPALFSIDALKKIKIKRDQNLSIRDLLTVVNAQAANVPAFNHYQLMNANTPAQWKQCKLTLAS